MDFLTKATIALDVVTALLVLATIWVAIETRMAAKRQLGVQTWLAFVERFDSTEMRRSRKKLAALLDPYDSTKHDKINETVTDFFEDVGIAYDHGCLDKKLAASSFSYYANHWWEAAKAYVDQERRNCGGDKSFFEDFEKLARAMRGNDPKITTEALQDFLKDERSLNTD